MSQRQQNRANRREFLRQAAAASATVVAAPYFVPAAALGYGGNVAASERIVAGCIGTGGQGRGLMNGLMGQKDVQVVAVCDVDAGHRRQAQEAVHKKYGNKDCAAYEDFRELLAREDIDAVSIATPDHWHALTSVAAANAKKDVYCEKPLANSVAEGRAICEAIKKNERVLQCGSHERSTASIRFACELVRSGRIGKVHTIRINLPCTDGHHKKVMAQKTKPATRPVPQGLDFDFWLGHTPKVEYRPFMEDEPDRRCHFWWRFILAYGGGEMTDRGAHVIDIAQLGAGMDHTGPVEFEAAGTRASGSVFDAFMDYKFTNTYANGLKMIGSTQEPRGLKFEGEDGFIFIHIHGGKLEANPDSLLKEDASKLKVQLGRSPGHQRNFLECIKNRKETMATAEIGHRTGSICHLNNIAMLTGQKLKWDPIKEQVTNSDEANKLLKPEMRAPWKL